MPLHRFRLRSLMIAVAVVAVGLWVGIPLCEALFFSDPMTRIGIVVGLIYGVPMVGYLGACAFLLVRYRHL